MPRLAAQRFALEPEQVNVALPAKVAYDLKAFRRVQDSILDRLGCPACCSGYDIRWDILQTFAVDEELNVREIAGGGFIHR